MLLIRFLSPHLYNSSICTSQTPRNTSYTCDHSYGEGVSSVRDLTHRLIFSYSLRAKERERGEGATVYSCCDVRTGTDFFNRSSMGLNVTTVCPKSLRAWVKGTLLIKTSSTWSPSLSKRTGSRLSHSRRTPPVSRVLLHVRMKAFLKAIWKITQKKKIYIYISEVWCTLLLKEVFISPVCGDFWDFI